MDTPRGEIYRQNSKFAGGGEITIVLHPCTDTVEIWQGELNLKLIDAGVFVCEKSYECGVDFEKSYRTHIYNT